jgi:hypothetical protein
VPYRTGRTTVAKVAQTFRFVRAGRPEGLRDL